jgi:membrane-bound serine protease (ClpP class)
MIFIDRIFLFFKGVILEDTLTTKDGYVSNINRTDLIGKQGFTLTQLSPVGYIEVDGERLEVISEGIYVDINKQVTVLKVEGYKVVVRLTVRQDDKFIAKEDNEE